MSIPAPEPNEPVHKDISVDQVREVERAAALAPFEGRTRVVIIDPADAMSIGAQNAFLKTLEEPPPNTAFVLIATREDRLLETVRSRCRRIEFTLVPLGEIEAALKSLTPGPSSYGGRTSPEPRERGEKVGPKGLAHVLRVSRRSRRGCWRGWPAGGRGGRWSWRKTRRGSRSGGRRWRRRGSWGRCRWRT